MGFQKDDLKAASEKYLLWFRRIVMVEFLFSPGDPDSDEAVRLSHWQRHWEHSLEVSWKQIVIHEIFM